MLFEVAPAPPERVRVEPLDHFPPFGGNDRDAAEFAVVAITSDDFSLGHRRRHAGDRALIDGERRGRIWHGGESMYLGRTPAPNRVQPVVDRRVIGGAYPVFRFRSVTGNMGLAGAVQNRRCLEYLGDWFKQAATHDFATVSMFRYRNDLGSFC